MILRQSDASPFKELQLLQQLFFVRVKILQRIYLKAQNLVIVFGPKYLHKKSLFMFSFKSVNIKKYTDTAFDTHEHFQVILWTGGCLRELISSNAIRHYT